MPITFPENPSVGQVVSHNGRSWQWIGRAWDLYGNASPHKATHATGGADALAPADIGAMPAAGGTFTGNVQVGTSNDGLRYLDVTNTHSSSGSGSVLRVISQAISGAGATAAGVLAKYKNGLFTIYNNEPNAAAVLTFGIGAAEIVRLTSSGNLGLNTQTPAVSSGAGLHIAGSTLRVATARTPANSSATGNTGEFCWDANYLYVCTATNTWKRAALSSW